MKLQLDTTNKIIKVEEKVNLGEFIELLEQQILPNGKWKEFTLETKTIINWTNPVIIERDRPFIQPYVPPTYPPLQPWITCSTDNAESYKLKSGMYNIEA